MLNAIFWVAVVSLACTALAIHLKTFIRDALNEATNRALDKVTRRLTSDEQLRDALRQMISDGIRRAAKAERDEAEFQSVLGKQ